MIQKNCPTYPFLKATQGNWRNAVFITCNCSACPYGQKAICEGFLLASNADGTPIILSLEKFRSLSTEPIDPAECCGTISRQAFEAMYHLYLQWHLASFETCPLLIHSQKSARNCCL